jgi:hypothetical protein
MLHLLSLSDKDLAKFLFIFYWFSVCINRVSLYILPSSLPLFPICRSSAPKNNTMFLWHNFHIMCFLQSGCYIPHKHMFSQLLLLLYHISNFLTDQSVSASGVFLDSSSPHLIFTLQYLFRISLVSKRFIPSLANEGGNPTFISHPHFVYTAGILWMS